ncbi:MAG TPA: hypothetical protein VH592_10675 [Gemmataceae bacterium]|jgi:hypothetical protein
MNPLKVSAMFAAYVWFTEREGNSVMARREAASFACSNWESFLPSAHEGLGRLLIRVARVRKRDRKRRKKTPVGIAG